MTLAVPVALREADKVTVDDRDGVVDRDAEGLPLPEGDVEKVALRVGINDREAVVAIDGVLVSGGVIVEVLLGDVDTLPLRDAEGESDRERLEDHDAEPDTECDCVAVGVSESVTVGVCC